MPSLAREPDEFLDSGRVQDRLRFGRPASAHRNDHDLAIVLEKPCETTGDRGLADSLSGPDDGDRRNLERRPQWRVKPEVRADIGNAESENAARESKALDRPENGLVGEIDDDLGRVGCDRRFEVGGERHPVLLAAAQLLTAADEQRGDELVRQLRECIANNRGVVLAVDYGEGSQVRVVTSSSIEPVNFAYSSVSSENETSRTWPWKG